MMARDRVRLGRVGVWVPGFASSGLTEAGDLAFRIEALGVAPYGWGEANTPRVLAALGTKMLELARDRTAGAHPYLVTPDHTAMARRVLGPDPLLAPVVAVVVSSQPDDARRIGREYLASSFSLPNYVDNFRRLGFAESDFAAGGSDRLVDAVVPSGDPEAVALRVKEHFDAGADHVCVQPMGKGRTVDLKGLAELIGALGES